MTFEPIMTIEKFLNMWVDLLPFILIFLAFRLGFDLGYSHQSDEANNN
jgi:hypothetical protein